LSGQKFLTAKNKSAATQPPYTLASIPYKLFLFMKVKLLPLGLLVEDIPEVQKQTLIILLRFQEVSSRGVSCRGCNPGKVA
jgi:hypothetical protein